MCCSARLPRSRPPRRPAPYSRAFGTCSRGCASEGTPEPLGASLVAMDYPPIEDYGAVGNGRTVALISRGGSVDWWCVPDLDSPSVFGAALDTRRGGRCELAPAVPGESSRRYVEGTNVLETTHRCGEGVVRVTDALSEEISASILVRRVEGLAGEVPVTWTVAPRFDYGREAGHFSTTPGIGWFRSDELEVAVQAWALGDAEAGPGSLSGGATLRTGDTGLLAV